MTNHWCALVEAMWVQMRALEMFGTFMPVLFKIGVWKCHLDTWLFSRIITKVNSTPNGGHSYESNVPVLYFFFGCEVFLDVN